MGVRIMNKRTRGEMMERKVKNGGMGGRRGFGMG